MSASEQRQRVLNSNSNHQGEFRSRPGANHIVRLDSEQMELLMNYQQNQESVRTTRASAPPAPVLESQNSKGVLPPPPTYEEYISKCDQSKVTSDD